VGARKDRRIEVERMLGRSDKKKWKREEKQGTGEGSGYEEEVGGAEGGKRVEDIKGPSRKASDKAKHGRTPKDHTQLIS